MTAPLPIVYDVRMNSKRTVILSNKAKCKLCNTIVESTTRHHLAMCNCGAIFVDGGTSYLRRGGNLDAIEDMSMVQEVEHDETRTKNAL